MEARFTDPTAGATPPPPAQPPFPGVKPDYSDERIGVYCWFTEPAGILYRYSPGLYIDETVATLVSTTCDAMLHKRFPETKRLQYVHDFSDAGGYSTKARQILVEWGRRVRGDVLRTVMIAPPTNAFIRMGISAGVAVLRVLGGDVSVYDTLAEAIKAYEIRPASLRR